MKGPTPRRLHQYACRVGLGDYLRAPGDGRSLPRILAASLLWSLLLCKVLRVPSFYGTGMLARHAPGALGLRRPFGDDALAYFTERLDLPFDVEFYASGENERTRAATSRSGTAPTAHGRGSTRPGYGSCATPR